MVTVDIGKNRSSPAAQPDGPYVDCVAYCANCERAVNHAVGVPLEMIPAQARFVRAQPCKVCRNKSLVFDIVLPYEEKSKLVSILKLFFSRTGSAAIARELMDSNILLVADFDQQRFAVGEYATSVNKEVHPSDRNKISAVGDIRATANAMEMFIRAKTGPHKFRMLTTEVLSVLDMYKPWNAHNLSYLRTLAKYLHDNKMESGPQWKACYRNS